LKNKQENNRILRVSLEMLLHANGRERLDEHERNSAAPATVAPPIPAAQDACRRKAPPFIAGMWKVLAAQNDAIYLSQIRTVKL